MPVMVPATSAVNFTPISTGLSGPPSTPTGVAVLGQMVQLVVHGDPEPPTDTVTPAEGISRFPLSSTARLLIVTEPDVPEVFQLYVQLARPLAGCHVAPPLTETSTPPTTPPPPSVAVPLMVTVLPWVRIEPPVGETIVEVGAVVSVDAVAATSPAWRVAGCTPMSANRFTVACCIRTSV